MKAGLPTARGVAQRASRASAWGICARGEQEVEIFCRGEIELPVIAPGDHVHGAAWGNDPRSARHPNPQHGAHEIIIPTDTASRHSHLLP